jgi:CRISPR-associated endoribonuclease Cas6/Csy4 subtype I-F
MHPAHYFDLEIRRGTDLNVPDVLSLALRILHGVGKAFALSLPNMHAGNLGEKTRVFCASIADLEHIQDRMENGPLDDYVTIRCIKPAPQSCVFESFTTLNVKAFNSRNTRRVKRGNNPYSDVEISKIQEKNKSLNEVNFITVRSKSNGYQFKLYITRNIVAMGGGSPDAYGFSSPSNIVALPVFD